MINKYTNENIKSSKLVLNFLKENNLHKKDFAQMIGVTLSYVYNLIDENVPFSTRKITIERIATVMDIKPETFIEYQIHDEYFEQNENLTLIKNKIKENHYTTLEFIKFFDKKKRLEIVDILRGSKPIYIDFQELKNIANILNMKKDELFYLWKNRLIEYLKLGGFNIEKNKILLNAMFDCAKKTIQ